MSDLSIYELEDIIWDDFERNGDHIVPHPSNNHGSEDKYEGDSFKRPRLEVTPLQSNESDIFASGSVCQVKEERDPTLLNKERNMIEKDSWSHTPEGVFASSGDADTGKDMPSIQSGDTKISNHCFKSSNVTSGRELCIDEGILKDTATAVDSNSYNFPPNHIHQSDDLNLFSNDDDKESSDLLYYGWPDIGNFEDVDRMLSNCDSSFGLGITGNDDELGWLTSEDPSGGYEEALKVDLKFPSSQPSALISTSHDHEPRGSDNSESKDEFKLKDQHVNLLKEQSRQQNQTEEKKAGQCLGNYGLKSNDIQISSDQVFTSIYNQQQNKNSGHDSFDHIKSSTYLHQGHDHCTMQPVGGQMMTGIKYVKGTSHSQKETYNATRQVHSMDISGDPSFQGMASEICGKVKAHNSDAFQSSVSENQRQSDMMLQASRSDLVSSQNQSCTPENKVESQIDMEGVKKGTSAELGSLDELEGSSVSSELDEISLEATSFRQLQQVMEQLDLRTKLCIRDSLYRLARSAEQRHNYAGLSNTTSNCGGTGVALMTEGTNKCTGFMDMETDTNPIDRTIAHLLFHRPPDSSNVPFPSPLVQNAKVQEEVGNQSDDKVSSTRKN